MFPTITLESLDSLIRQRLTPTGFMGNPVPGGPKQQPAKVFLSALGGILPQGPAPGSVPMPIAPPGGPAAQGGPAGPGGAMPAQKGLTQATEASQNALLAYIDELSELQDLPEGSPQREEAEQRADMLWSMIHGEDSAGEDEGPPQPGDAHLKQAMSIVPISISRAWFMQYAGPAPGTTMGGQAVGQDVGSGEWTRYDGPRGGKGWKNSRTGRILYTQSPTAPGHMRRQREQSAGRAQSISERVLAHYNAPHEEHAPSEQELQELATHLPKLNKDQLRNTRNRLMASFGGGKRREEMVTALRKHVADLVRTRSENQGRLFPHHPGRDAEAEQLQQQRQAKRAARPAAAGGGGPGMPATAGAPRSTPLAGEMRVVPTEHLKIDPHRFQFKMNTNEQGVTDEFKGVKWNPELGGVLAVWHDPENGQDYVVNGHHRYDIAKRSGTPHIAVRYLNARDAKEARAKGALINISEGKGTPVDAAKFMRDMQVGPEDLSKHGVSLKGNLARDAVHLRNLSDPLFHRLTLGQMETNRAVPIGQHLAGKPDLQNQLVNYIDRREEATGREWTPKMVDEAAREVAAAPSHTKEEGGLFGGTSEASYLEERAALKSHIRAQLAKTKRDFEAVSSEQRAKNVAGAGNVLATEKNKELAQKHAQSAELFDRTANLKGPVADLINEYAEKYSNATKQQRDKLATELTGRVREQLAAGPDAGRPAPAALGTGKPTSGGAGVAGTGNAGTAGSGAPATERGGLQPGVERGGGGAGITARDENAVPGQPPPKDKPIAMVFGGSFSPGHAGHVEAMDKAKKHLESQGYKVGKVIVAPSADKLLRAKLGDQLVPLAKRAEIMKAQLGDRPDVEVSTGPGDEAEQFQGKLKRVQLADWAAKNFPGMRVVNVTGQDAAPEGHGGQFPSIYSGERGTAHEGYYYAGMPRDEGEGGISSGKIRKAIAEGKPIPAGFMSPAAEKAYREHLATAGATKKPAEAKSAAAAEPQIVRTPGLTPEDAKLEEESQRYAHQNYEKLKEAYLKENAVPGPEGSGHSSVTLNTDEWRHHLPGYVGTNAGAVHEAASWLNKRLSSEILAQQKGKGNGQMLILAGGGGSGKGSAAPKFVGMSEYPVILDQVSDNLHKLQQKMDEAESHGFDPAYVFVDRPAKQAAQAVIGRAVDLRKQGKLARTVELDRALKANQNARKVALELLKSRPDVTPRVLVNDLGKPGLRRLIENRDEAIAHLEEQVRRDEQEPADTLHHELTQDTLGRHEAGEIPEDIAEGLIGRKAFQAYKSSRMPSGSAPDRISEESENAKQPRVPESGAVPGNNAKGPEPARPEDRGRGELPGVAGTQGGRATAGQPATGGTPRVGGEAKAPQLTKRPPTVDPSRWKHGGTATPDEAKALRGNFDSLSDSEKTQFADQFGIQHAKTALPATRDDLVRRKIRELAFKHEQDQAGNLEPAPVEGKLFGETGRGESAGLFDAPRPSKMSDSDLAAEISARNDANKVAKPAPQSAGAKQKAKSGGFDRLLRGLPRADVQQLLSENGLTLSNNDSIVFRDRRDRGQQVKMSKNDFVDWVMGNRHGDDPMSYAPDDKEWAGLISKARNLISGSEGQAPKA